MNLTGLNVLQLLSILLPLASSSLTFGQIKKTKVKNPIQYEVTEIKTEKNKPFFKLTFPAKQPFFDSTGEDENKFTLSFTTLEDNGEMLYTASGFELKAYNERLEALIPLQQLTINLSPKAESLFIIRRETGVMIPLEFDKDGTPTSFETSATVCKIVKLKIKPVNQNGKVVKIIEQTTKLDSLDKFKVKHPRPKSPLVGCEKLSFF